MSSLSTRWGKKKGCKEFPRETCFERVRLTACNAAFLPQPHFAGCIPVHAILQPQKICGLDSSIPQIWPICGTNCKFCGCGCRTRVHCNPVCISSRIIFLEIFTNEPSNEPTTENVLLAGKMQNSRALLSTRIFSPKICGCGCSFACNQSKFSWTQV